METDLHIIGMILLGFILIGVGYGIGYMHCSIRRDLSRKRDLFDDEFNSDN